MTIREFTAARRLESMARQWDGEELNFWNRFGPQLLVSLELALDEIEGVSCAS